MRASSAPSSGSTPSRPSDGDACRRLGALAEAGLLRLLLPRPHGFMSENQFEAVGQAYCGVAPEFGMVAF